MKESFLYLAILVALPALLFSGINLYNMNEFMAEINNAVEGNLPSIRVEKGIVHMEGDTFRFEQDKEYTVGDWGNMIINYPRTNLAAAFAAAKRDRGRKLAEKEEELAKEFDASTTTSQEALNWMEENFPDPDAKVKKSEIQKRLNDLPKEKAEMINMLREISLYGSVVFLVDLTGKEPEFPPGTFGFALSKDKYYTNMPIFGKSQRELSKDTSAIINDEWLGRKRRQLIWEGVPAMLAIFYLACLVATFIVLAGGSAVSALTTAVLKCSLPFRRIFSISLYALTPAVLFMVLSVVLMLIWLRMSFLIMLVYFLVIYGVYLIGATRKCCTLD